MVSILSKAARAPVLLMHARHTGPAAWVRVANQLKWPLQHDASIGAGSSTVPYPSLIRKL